MTAPNMATITASLERSLQNCSLNHHDGGGGGGASGSAGLGRSSSSDDVSESQPNSFDSTLELNSHISLPYHWEQCLDLKTGEIYYINWRTGMKAKEDPRVTADYSGTYYYSDDDEDNSSNYDSEESSSESSPPSSSTREPPKVATGKDHVLVVAGCKTCLMYYMVPKQVEDCPRCGGQLLHFDRPENGSL
ncbi:uncharacterized protein LOC116209987 [Punica granatum]|uniref:Uncharacterized protein LOC116190390 n=2 Tax=Punica granatum TaxID=22663 RepID=A0A6P8C3J5_PUNGR|nr:uncharacterized protein LOC116190390 [Punica granatum]XP_031399620.1 uncharacterized protein LOC116209987 [Punica granatum]